MARCPVCLVATAIRERLLGGFVVVVCVYHGRQITRPEESSK